MADHGLLQGTISMGMDPLPGEEVVAKLIEGGQEIAARTDQYGYYSIELAAGAYSVLLKQSENVIKEIVAEIQIENGMTATFEVRLDPELPPEVRMDSGKVINLLGAVEEPAVATEAVSDPAAETVSDPVSEPVVDPAAETTTDPAAETTTDPVV